VIRRGSYVISLKGHDTGRIYLVTELDEAYAYVSDGREHRIARPKRKNIKHIFPILEGHIEDPAVMTDGVLRKLLREKGNIYDSIVN
jgi:ribosomal protein L14E/L6E/L27E